MNSGYDDFVKQCCATLAMLVAIFTVQACDAQDAAGLDTLTVDLGRYAIDYGPQQELQGVWLAEYEGSNFNYCATDSPGCPAMMFDNWGCWLSFSEPAREQLAALLTEQPAPYEVEGVFIMSFAGRETFERGQYGHLGGSSCEVLVEDLHSIESFDPGRDDNRMRILMESLEE